MAAAAGAATTSHTRVAVCTPGHANLYAANERAQVYATREQIFEARTHAPLREEVVYRGCVYGSTRTVSLGHNTADCSAEYCSGTEHLTLDGSIVAYEESSSAAGPPGLERSTWLVVVRDLRTGRLLHKVPTGTASPARPGVVGHGQVTEIVVEKDGAVAWIVDTVQPAATYQVHALDASGERVLAVGSDIEPLSLALVGKTLYWTQGGKASLASLR
jgi:hypothetical protein